jgi:alpha-tubulin suppressor-like RCC1 family protein
MPNPRKIIMGAAGVSGDAPPSSPYELWSWGRNQDSVFAVGNNTSGTSYSSPVQIGTEVWTDVASIGNWVQAIDNTGKLYGWAYGTAGQSGNNNAVSLSSPVQIGSATDWAMSCRYNGGPSQTGAITTGNKLYMWGRNYEGACGFNEDAFISSPVQVGSLTNWGNTDGKYSCGSVVSANVKTDGTLWTWGQNSQGELGDGSTTQRKSPVQIGSLTNWSQIACGLWSCAAVKTDGTLWSWGKNEYGELGLGNTTKYSSPVQVGSATNWSQVGMGRSMWVINSSGELYSCGRNDYGQLGQGNTTNTSTLAQVGSLTDWRVIDGAENSFLATKTDYTLWACGNGVFGGLGQGNTTSYSSPVQVGSEEIWERPTNDNRGMSKALAN